MEAQVTKITEEIQGEPFSTGHTWNDVYDWSNRLAALGEVISALAWHERNGGSECLHQEGEHLGEIIRDYAQAIRITIDKNLEKLCDMDESIISPLSRSQEVLDFLKGKETLNPSDLMPINYQIERLEEFLNAVLPGFDIKADFVRLRDRIQEALKREAPTTEATAAEA